MLTELCQELRNWFNRKPDGEDMPKWIGTFRIASGSIAGLELTNGQYYRIIGSLFNDGVHKYGDASDTLTDEEFEGVVWSMAVPPQIVTLANDIAAWVDKYGGIDSSAMSPFNSESFGGYSYSKSSGGSTSCGGSSGGGTWQSVFAGRMKYWRKL